MININITIKKDGDNVVKIINSEHLVELINSFRNEELPNANEPFHYEAEISAGLDSLIRWIDQKSKNEVGMTVYETWDDFIERLIECDYDFEEDVVVKLDGNSYIFNCEYFNELLDEYGYDVKESLHHSSIERLLEEKILRITNL